MFSESELEYLGSQRLGRLATVDGSGAPQNSPVGFRVNPDNTIDIAGRAMAETRKWRNIAGNPAVSFVVDDIASIDPWVVRAVEIRGDAEQVLVEDTPIAGLRPETIRIHPKKVISWGI